ncbi:HMA2 domain-containing protein [Thioalkalivibrio sp.]|uniref:HMA2 domain-containing protein n=1 Tax=Thioalkalivibrio sp. TaxID=2093813 RepID=UPI0039750F34
MSAPDLDTLLAMRGHVHVAHHVPGRIRLRIAPTLVKNAWRVDRNRIEQALRSIRGIGGVRVNPAAGSVVVEYLPSRVAPETWDVLLNGDTDAARASLEALLGLPQAPASDHSIHADFRRPSDKETT